MATHCIPAALFTLAFACGAMFLPAHAEESSGSEIAAVEMEVNRPDGVYHVGDKLRVGVRANVDAHVYVFYHQEDGTAVMLYPTFASPRSCVRAHSRLDVSGVREGIALRLNETAGTEVVQVLVAGEQLPEFDRLIDPRGGGYPVVATQEVDTYCQRLSQEGVLWDAPRADIRVVGNDE